MTKWEESYFDESSRAACRNCAEVDPPEARQSTSKLSKDRVLSNEARMEGFQINKEQSTFKYIEDRVLPGNW